MDHRYRVVGQLGSGAMGTVFRARDVHLEREVALKLLRPQHSMRAHELFEGEARALAEVRHDNVPIIYSFGVHGHAPFFTMELVDGEPLAEIIEVHAQHGAVVPLHRALQIIDRVAAALGATHTVGVLHRDVKPENVLIEHETGRPMLVDFGVAAREGSGEGLAVGTPAFMAPEIWAREAPTHRSDIYALGCLAFELLTGAPVFEVDDVRALRIAHRGKTPRAPSTLRADLKPYDELLARCLAKDPEDRYATCAGFRAAITRASEGRAATFESEPPLTDALRVLVIDDDPVFARIARRAAKVAFAGSTVEVTQTPDAETGLVECQRWMPQLILLDYNMPGMNGVEMLSRLRAMPQGDTVSVVVMSGAIGREQRWRFSALGVREFLEKPAEFGKVVETIMRKGRSRGWLPGDSTTRETEEELD